MKRPALVMTACLIIGILTGTFISLNFYVFILLITALFLSVIFSGIMKKNKIPGLIAAAQIFLCFVLIGIYLQNKVINENETAEKYAGIISSFRLPVISGRIDSVNSISNEMTKVFIKDIQVRESLYSGNSELNIPGNLYLQIIDKGKGKINLEPGMSIRFRAPVRAPQNKGFFKYKDFLKNQKIYYVSRIFSAGEIEIVSDSKTIFEKAMTFSMKLSLYMKSLIYQNLSPANAKVGVGILLGIMDSSAGKEYEDFKDTGLLHLFSVSGLHTTMIAAAILFAFRMIAMPHPLRLSVTFIALTIFVAAAGFTAPSIRAYIMISAFLILDILKREASTLDVLIFACFFTLLFDTRALFSPSFQMSYLAVFFIIINTETIASAFRIKSNSENYYLKRIIHYTNTYLISGILISLIINLSMLPLTVCQFNKFSIIAPLSNLIAVPLTFIIMIFSIAALIFSTFSSALMHLSFFPVEIAVSSLRSVSSMLASLKFSSIAVRDLPFWAIFIYYTILLTSKHISDIKNIEAIYYKRWRFCIHYLAALAFFLVIRIAVVPDNKLSAVFMDVGQGDSALITLPSDASIIIDTGKGAPSDAAKNVIAPYLWSCGIDNIDILLLTHADEDHIGGTETLLNNFDISSLIVSKYFDKSPEGKRLLNIADEKGITVTRVERGDIVKNSGVEISILDPESNEQESSKNETSIVARISFREIDMLFTGDAEKESEKSMVVSDINLNSEVLKVGHHGSANASNDFFLDKVKPRIAVISVGEKNQYSHPSARVLERLESEDCEIFRTDKNGFIEIITDGYIFNVTPYQI